MKVVLIIAAAVALTYWYNMNQHEEDIFQRANATVIVRVLPGMMLEDR